MIVVFMHQVAMSTALNGNGSDLGGSARPLSSATTPRQGAQPSRECRSRYEELE
jgi:hypothetical protein